MNGDPYVADLDLGPADPKASTLGFSTSDRSSATVENADRLIEKRTKAVYLMRDQRAGNLCVVSPIMPGMRPKAR